MSWWHKPITFCRDIVYERRFEADMDDELQTHVEMQTEHNMRQGMSRDEARTEALKAFGGVEQIKEQCREAIGVALVKTFWQDVRYGMRVLWKNPGFTLIAVTTLALGIGATTAIFSVVNSVLLRSLPYPEPDRLVMVWENGPKMPREQSMVTARTFFEWEEQNTVFSDVGYIWNFSHESRKFNLIHEDATIYLQGRFVTASLFDVFQVKPLLGRTFTPEEDKQGAENVVVLGHKLWQSQFGGRHEIVGQTITLDSYTRRREFMVIGVMPRGFEFPNDTELWLNMASMGTLERYRTLPPMLNRLHVVGRLKPGITAEQARAELDTIGSRLLEEFPDARFGPKVVVVPMLEQLVGTGLQRALWVLFGAVGCVLVLACANVANLQIARSIAREREIAVRTALGASRLRIVRQLLTESILLSVIGGGLGLLLASWGVGVLSAMMPHADRSYAEISADRVKDVSIDTTVLMVALGVTVVTGIVFGLAPAWHASKPDLNSSLKGGGRGATHNKTTQRIRGALVVAQVSVALVLLIGAGLMIQSFTRLMQVDPGFRTDHMLVGLVDWVNSDFGTHQRRIESSREIVKRMSGQPGVESVCGTGELPLIKSGWTTEVFPDGTPADPLQTVPMADIDTITPNYFGTFDIPILYGRDFDEGDLIGKPPVAIINKKLAEEMWPGVENPVGKRFGLRWRNRQREVVGVVADTRRSGLAEEVPPMLYIPYWQAGTPIFEVIVRTKIEPTSLANTLRSEVLDVTKAQPVVKLRTIEDIRDDSVAESRFQAQLLAGFGIVALVLATTGIYGVISYSVAQRFREIGIRMALGARASQVLALIMRQGLTLTLLGVLIGLACAYAAARLIENQLYDTPAIHPLLFAVSAVILIAVSTIASYIPARRATRVDPTVALHYE